MIGGKKRLRRRLAAGQGNALDGLKPQSQQRRAGDRPDRAGQHAETAGHAAMRRAAFAAMTSSI